MDIQKTTRRLDIAFSVEVAIETNAALGANIDSYVGEFLCVTSTDVAFWV